MKKFYYWSIANIGIDPKTFVSFFLNIPRFTSDYFKFRKRYKGKMTLRPYLNDRKNSAGYFLHDYFVQDIFAAQLVHELNPEKVVDVASRIDGYIGHLISFRPVEMIDIRPMKFSIPNLSFIQMNFADHSSVKESYTDFISCLHSIEHFGLGRYGDPIDTTAVPAALKSFSKITKPGGHFMFSTTFGRERVIFNEQWVFDIERMADQLCLVGFDIESLYYLHDHAFAKADLSAIARLAWEKDRLVLLLCRKKDI